MLTYLELRDIKLHETTETNRLRNIYERISNSKYLMNPVIVGNYGINRYLLTDITRLSTLKEIGCKLIIAQLTDYKSKRIRYETGIT